MSYVPCCDEVFGSGSGGGGGMALFFSDDVKTADYTAQLGEIVRYDPTGVAPFTISAPPNPMKDARFGIKNESDSMQPVSISGNGSNIENVLDFETVAITGVLKNGAMLTYRYTGTDWLLST